MPSLYAEIEINAPKQQVWQALVRKDTWKYWNTYLYDCDPRQPLQPGARVLLATRRIAGEEDTEFSPLITRVEPGRYLQWVTTIPGLKVVQAFELQDLGGDRTYYIQREIFSGFLTRVIFPLIRRDEQEGMRRMTWELKRYVEQGNYQSETSLSRGQR
jgi:hypothetical protein